LENLPTNDEAPVQERLVEKSSIERELEGYLSKIKFGDLLAVCRKSRGLTLAEFGSLIGGSKQYVSGVENGRNSISLVKALRIASHIGEDPAFFARIWVNEQLDDSGFCHLNSNIFRNENEFQETAELEYPVLDFFADYICSEIGIRIQQQMYQEFSDRLLEISQQLGLGDLQGLYDHCKSHEIDETLNEYLSFAALSNSNSFFQNRNVFEEFEAIVNSGISESKNKAKKIRIWCVGCGRGEEAYSIALLLEELGGVEYEIVATDSNSAVLKFAEEGAYSQFQAQNGLPSKLLLKYFTRSMKTKTQASFVVGKAIKSKIDFRHFSLQAKFNKLGDFDYIFCNHVFHPTPSGANSILLQKFHESLIENGKLLVGNDEKLSDPGFKKLFSKHKSKKVAFYNKLVS
jgi:chemotaxis protein methyltransferase CheR